MIDVNIETLLLSIKTEKTKDIVLNKLKDSRLLDVDESKLIKDYEALFNETKTIPTSSLLANVNPQYIDMPMLSNEDDLITYTNIFLRNRLKNKVSSNIINNIQSLNNSDKPIDEIVHDITEEARRLSITEDIVEEYDTVADAKRLYDEEDVSDRFKTGLEPIDEVCGGIPKGSVTIIMGGTGSFKTMTTTNICYNAMNAGKNICYLSLEVTQKHMYFNFISRHSVSGSFSMPLTHKDLKNKALSPEQEEQLAIISDDFNNIEGKCIVLDESNIKSFDITGFEEVISNSDKELIKMTGHGVDILVVDHAQLLKFSGSGRSQDPYLVVNYYMSWLRQMSLNFLGQDRDISVIVVSQASRAGMDYANKHGGQFLLTHAAEANEIERSASYMISVYANDMTRSSNELMVQLLKSRNSETMLEPATVQINPAYYQVGSGIRVESVTPIFKNQNLNSFDIGTEDLDSLFKS